MGHTASTKRQSTTGANQGDLDSDRMMNDLVDEISEEIDHEYNFPSGPYKDPMTKLLKSIEMKFGKALPDYVQAIHSIHDLYTYQNKIGCGVSGSVFLAQSNRSQQTYALKQMPASDDLNFLSFMSEITVLEQLHHPNIIKLKHAYVSSTDYYIATPYCADGTLLDRISKMKRFSERDCADFMKNILETVDYMHSNNIVHRDLKLSNIVFDKSDMQIIDFGQSELIRDLQARDRNIVGSLAYLPPETVQRRYKRDLFAGDLWSLGVIAFVLINGKVPFVAKSVQSLCRRIARSTSLKWNNDIVISESCKHFIESLLNKDKTERLNAKEALQHPWIVSKASEDDLGAQYFNTLKRVSFKNKLQKIMVSAALDGMEESHKRMIVTHDGYTDDNQLINQIISGQTPKSPRVYTHTREITNKQLAELDIDGMLDEIEAESGALDDIPSCTLNVNLLPSIDSMSSFSSSSPRMEDTISMQRFVEILASSPKKYDISQIVANVNDDGAEAITFEKIASYHHTIDSLDLNMF